MLEYMVLESSGKHTITGHGNWQVMGNISECSVLNSVLLTR